MYISWCIYYDMKLKFFEMNVVRNIVCEKILIWEGVDNMRFCYNKSKVICFYFFV